MNPTSEVVAPSPSSDAGEVVWKPVADFYSHRCLACSGTGLVQDGSKHFGTTSCDQCKGSGFKNPLFSLAQIKAVERERDEAHNLAREYQRQRNGNFDRATTAETQLAALTKRVGELEGALEPFACLGKEAAWVSKPDDKQAWGF